MTVPLLVGRAASIHAIERAVAKDRVLFVAAQKHGDVTDPSHDELYRVGSVVRLLQLFRLPDGTMRVLVEGLCRAHAEKFQWTRDAYAVIVAPLDEPSPAGAETEALMRSVLHRFNDYVHLHRRIPDEVLTTANNITDPVTLGHTVAANLLVKVPVRQRLLRPRRRQYLRMLGSTLASELEILAERRSGAGALAGAQERKGSISASSQGDPQGARPPERVQRANN